MAPTWVRLVDTRCRGFGTVGCRRLLFGLSLGLSFGSGADASAATRAPTPATPTPTTPDPMPASSTEAAPTPASPEAEPESGSPPPGERDALRSELYGDRLDGLQAEINDLKDKIFRSKARLAVLRETVLRGVMAGSRVVLTHRNSMGTGFRLVRVVYRLDGAQIFARTDDTGALDAEDELVVFDGNLAPGAHSVDVELTYQGNGYGVFSYLSGYTFESRSHREFAAPPKGALQLGSVGYEEGNLTTEMRDRPAVVWQETLLDAAGRPIADRGQRRVSRSAGSGDADKANR